MAEAVRATTKQEVDAAFLMFGGPDEIVVEGDSELLRYAEERAIAESERAEQPQAERSGDRTKAGGDRAWHFGWFVPVAIGLVAAAALAEKISFDAFLDKWGGTVIWAIVALAAIGGMYSLATRALNKGHDVAVQWKVTKAVAGKLTIKRVETRVPKKRKKK
jgi:hypothetical protein